MKKIPGIALNELTLSYKLFNMASLHVHFETFLKKAIKRRYKKTLVHLSDMKKLSMGVGLTELKIIKRFKMK